MRKQEAVLGEETGKDTKKGSKTLYLVRKQEAVLGETGSSIRGGHRKLNLESK